MGWSVEMPEGQGPAQGCDCEATPGCCEPGGAPGAAPAAAPYVKGSVKTAVGDIPLVDTTLVFADRLGSWKARWNMGRMSYIVAPGLYGFGAPTSDSPVFVSANYKMSFDRLRSELTGRDGWILVLDTQGINVWCAAGKGSFGTAELVNRIDRSRLAQVVSHHKLIVPQLGAPGVSAHEVKAQSGFRVVYGPVLAADLPAFLDEGMKASEESRRVRFPIVERIKLIPVELVLAMKWALLIGLVFLAASGLGSGGYQLARVLAEGIPSFAFVVLTTLAASVLAPALLPWLPGRAFCIKGLWIGAGAAAGAIAVLTGTPGAASHWATLAAWALMLPAIASFVAMNFTGASTYTSLSGVMKEMRIAVPVQGVAVLLGLVLWVLGRFVS